MVAKHTSGAAGLTRAPRRLTRALPLLLLAMFLGCWLRPAAAFGERAAAGASGGKVYLPLVTGAARTAPQPNPNPQTGGFFVEPEKKTGRPGIVIDPAGGLHMAYRYHVPYAEHPQAVYAYCPPPSSQCVNPANWGRVAFLDRVEEVQLELTPAGKPRLLIMLGDADNSYRSLFAYAECDGNCLSEESWRAIGVQTRYDTLGSVFEYSTPRRSFELDAQGRPRFVYYDRDYTAEPDHVGGFYLWCDAGCTSEGAWNEVRFTQQSADDNESISEPVLKFTRDGRPRVLAQLNPLGNGAPGTELRFDLYYISCDSDCDTSESWQRVRIAERGSGYEPAWDLELDPATDAPRAVNYQSGQQKLYYHWCDGACLSQSGWRTLDLSLGGWGMGVDLKLDAQGRPRMALLNTAQGAGIMFCNSACGQRASWSSRLVETLADLDHAYPVARPVTCNNGLWYVYAPSFVFDAQGNPHLIYDAAYQARCQYTTPGDPAPPTDVFHEIWHAVRYVALR